MVLEEHIFEKVCKTLGMGNKVGSRSLPVCITVAVMVHMSSGGYMYTDLISSLKQMVEWSVGQLFSAETVRAPKQLLQHCIFVVSFLRAVPAI